MLSLFSKSLAAKMSLAMVLVFVAMSASYLIINQRLKAIEDSFNNIGKISNYAVDILKINKDIVEMQRDISVYGASGSAPVFKKIMVNYDSIESRLTEINIGKGAESIQIHLDGMTELVSRYGANLKVLTLRFTQRNDLIEKELPQIYLNAVSLLENLKAKATDTNEKLYVTEYLNLWHMLHRDANQFLTKKDYAKRAEVEKTLNSLSKNVADRSKFKNMIDLSNSYRNAFSKSVQANRNYLSLVNVVMAGDAIEFSTLANSLREDSLTQLKQIKRDAQTTVLMTESILNALALMVVIYIVALSLFFHLQITRAIKRLTNSFTHFLNGDLEAPIYELKRNDEIGILAKAANKFRELSKDLSEAKHSAEHTTKVKSEFLANMSHEIRTPMNGILGMARQMARTTLTSEQSKMLHLIQSSGASLLVIINDILDLSKIEASKIELESEPVDLSYLLEELRHLFQEQADSKNIQLYISTTPEVEKLAFLADETRLKQVLINLLGNAVKFTERGSVSLTVNIQEIGLDEVKLTFNVSDTGIGIASEHLGTLFEAFSQADTSITRRFGGTGLGLTISNKLLNLMEAPLKVESALGEGSHFYFDLKAKRTLSSMDLDHQDILLTTSKKVIDLSNINALVVEDNDINQIVIEAMLNEFNITSINMANNGQEAVEQCELGVFDIIFMDMQMPVLDGPQATLKIREFSAFKHTPIIALTANVLSTDKQRCFDAGMDDYIAKPLEYDALRSILLKWCKTNIERT
ncbi:ATP-binding protein [Pseudoalteromonas sp. D15MCD-2]|uniref:hybrid sensor histidine kinase/response regulator n=1 Tax=Pseudoalteromonas sp. D15MCD-2 TaxID=3138933 RepID=UPI0031584CC0